MCAWTPTSSTEGNSSSAATACAAAPDATEKPNLESSPPVRTNSCVWASTPGVTRTRTAGRADGLRDALSRRPRRAISSKESTDDATNPARQGGGQLFLGLVVPMKDQLGRRHAGGEGDMEFAPRCNIEMHAPHRRPAGPWPGRGTPWRHRPRRLPRPRPRPDRPGEGGTRRKRRAVSRIRPPGRARRCHPPADARPRPPRRCGAAVSARRGRRRLCPRRAW